MDTTSTPTSTASVYRFACADTSLGRLLVLMTDDSLVDIILGDHLSGLLAEARRRHPGSILVGDKGVNAARVAELVERFERPVPRTG